MQKFLSEPINISGVAAFRDRVIHGSVDDESRNRLQQLVAGMLQQFERHGVELVGNRTPFTPHMTLAKLNRKQAREINHIGQGKFDECTCISC